MKRAVILHGTDGHPSHNWQPWLKGTLEDYGYTVWNPELPGNHTPNRFVYNDFLLNSEWDFHDNVLIGHSSGTTSILNLLLDDRCPPIKAAVFVATFFELSEVLRQRPDVEVSQFDDLFPKDGFDFEKIKQKCSNFYFIHGDDDEWCPIDLAQAAHRKLGGVFITIPGGGHIGGQSGITELPQLIEVLNRDHIL